MIILYSSQDCPRCKELAAWLRSHGVSFLEKRLVEDLLQDGEVMTELHMNGISFRAAPVLQVGSAYHGPDKLFHRGKLDEAALGAMI